MAMLLGTRVVSDLPGLMYRLISAFSGCPVHFVTSNPDHQATLEARWIKLGGDKGEIVTLGSKILP